MIVNEQALFFDVGPRRLFALYHPPHQASTRPALVFCHPFAEEKLWAQRVFVSSARQMAAAGYPVLRFDFSGNGDSSGEFAESSVEGAIEEIAEAMRVARQLSGVSDVSLLGLRFGATLACLTADAYPGSVRDLVLWAPICDGARFMQDMLRVNLTTQVAVHKEVRMDREQLVAEMERGRTVNIDGYEMAHVLFSQASAINLGQRPAAHPGRCLVTHVGRTGSRIPAELEKLAGAYSRSTLVPVVAEPFWKEIPQFCQDAPALAAATMDWLAGD